MDLKKGLDERGRPEIMDAAVGLTRLENLITEQDGSWTKRPGLQYLGGSSITDDGASLPLCLRPIRTIGGLGVAGFQSESSNHGTTQQLTFYRYLEGRGRLSAARAARMSELSVNGVFVAASQALETTGTSGPRVVSVAGCTAYDAVVFESGTNQTAGAGPQLVLVIYERESGVEAARLTMPKSGTSTAPKLCFVADRYLHVYYKDATTLYPTITVIDTSIALPSSLAAGSTVVANANAIIQDVCVNDTHSFVGVAAALGIAPVVYKVAASGGAPVSSVTMPSAKVGSLQLSIALNWATDTVYAVYIDDATTRVRVATINTATMAATSLFLDPSLTMSTVGVYAPSISVADNGGLILVGQDTFTFSAGTSCPYINVYYTESSASTEFFNLGRINAWTAQSTPFYCRYTNKHYLHVVKYDRVTTDVATHAAVCISDTRPVYVSSYSYSAARVCAVLENSNGYQLAQPPDRYSIEIPNSPVIHRILRRGSDATASPSATYPAALSYRQAADSSAVAVYRLEFHSLSANCSVNFNGSTHVASGVLQRFDGNNFGEDCYVDQPFGTAVDSGVAGNVNGLVKYAFVFRSVNAVGSVTYSRTYAPVSITVANKQVSLSCSAPHLTSRDYGSDGDQQNVVEVYRTVSGGSQYLYVGKAVLTSSDGIFRLTDNIADASLGRVMFRQPGTNNSPLDRYCAPGGHGIICQHKDRVFVADPYGQRVWYSSFSVDGEGLWFNPAFSFFVNGGSGPVTGMASMDGRLIIFKKDAVFVVDGDGPPEGGGNGSEFTPPNRLAVEYGCVDHRSIVNTPLGVMYRSTMGLELLTRSLERKWIGELVQTTVNDNQVTLGSCLDNLGMVHFLLSDTDGIDNTRQSVELLLDLPSGAWSKIPHNIRGLTGIGTFDAGGEKVCYTAPGAALEGDYDTSVDESLGNGQTSTYPVMCLESAWIHVNGPQARQRIYDFFFLARKQASANHALKVSVAFNYVDSYTQVKTWEPSVINGLGIEQLNLNPSRQEVIAIRFKVEDQIPADTVTYPVGTAKGCDVLSMAIDVGMKSGGSKLAPDQKG